MQAGAWSALTSDCAPYDCAHSALLIHYKKVLTKAKIWPPRESNLTLEPDAHPTQHTGHLSLGVRNVVYIISCVWAVVLQECR